MRLTCSGCILSIYVINKVHFRNTFVCVIIYDIFERISYDSIIFKLKELVSTIRSNLIYFILSVFICILFICFLVATWTVLLLAGSYLQPHTYALPVVNVLNHTKMIDGTPRDVVLGKHVSSL